MWIAGSVAGAVGVLVVLLAFLLEPRTGEGARRSGLGQGLPRPGEVRRLRFPTTTWGGYDRRAVDAELGELADRYEALYLAAGPSVIAEAERRLGEAGRTGGGEPRPAAAEPATDPGEVS